MDDNAKANTKLVEATMCNKVWAAGKNSLSTRETPNDAVAAVHRRQHGTAWQWQQQLMHDVT